MKLTERDREALAHVKALVEETAASYTVVQLCRKSGLNAEKLKKGFKELFGMPVHRHHLEFKMGEARRLLLETELTISEIAFSLGYEEVSNFCAGFRKVVGMKAGEWRKNAG
jgi:AraC family transcriptional activator of pyochelin receptor